MIESLSERKCNPDIFRRVLSYVECISDNIESINAFKLLKSIKIITPKLEAFETVYKDTIYKDIFLPYSIN